MGEDVFAGKGVVDGGVPPGAGVDMAFYTPPSQLQLRFEAARDILEAAHHMT